MFILDVIPIMRQRSGPNQILSYFSTKELFSGSLVEVEVRKKAIMAIVIRCEPLKNRKLTLKKGLFQLKKVTRIVSQTATVAQWQLKLIRYIAEYYYNPLGSVANIIIPEFIAKEPKPIPELPTKKNQKISYQKTNNPQLDFKEHIEKYRLLGKQVIILVPEQQPISYFKKAYAEFSPIELSGKTSSKKRQKIWNDIQNDGFALIISTKIGLFLPFSDLGLIIIDDASNEHYVTDNSPLFDTIHVAKTISNMRSADILVSTIVPSVEIYQEFKDLEQFQVKADFIDMTREIKMGNFSPLAREVEDIIVNMQNGEKILLYIPRKGYATAYRCQHCARTVTCSECSTSLVFYNSPSESLRCHRCKKIKNIPKKCQYCGDYRFTKSGFGNDKIESIVKKLIKLQNLSIKLHRIDAENNKLPEIDATQKNIVIATQSVFGFKYSMHFDIAIALHSDYLDLDADFRAQERKIIALSYLNFLADKIIIQTYDTTKTKQALDLESFYDETNSERKEFCYPPHGLLTQLVIRDRNKAKVDEKANELEAKLRLWSAKLKLKTDIISSFSPLVHKEKNLYYMHIIMKTPLDRRRDRNRLLTAITMDWHINTLPKDIIL